jgi:hypothetical protein
MRRLRWSRCGGEIKVLVGWLGRHCQRTCFEQLVAARGRAEPVACVTDLENWW